MLYICLKLLGMGWFSFNSKEREYNISISAIAKEFGISRGVINALMKEAGYNPGQFIFTNLAKRHLEIILLAYVHSIKSLYKESSKNFSNYSLKEQEELKVFFGKFIRKTFFLPEVEIRINDRILPASNGKIFKSDLDNDLIRDYFFKRIEQLEIEQEFLSYNLGDFDGFDLSDLVNSLHYTPRPSFIYRQMNWTIKIKHTFTYIKSRIFTITLTGHYYIFSAEEDSAAALIPSITRCFSAVKLTPGEALNINISKLTPTWKPVYMPLLKG